MPGIFISYRREDSGPYAGRLYDGLVAHLGRDSVFFDIDTIHPGEDFREAIQRTLADCEVLLAVIGRHWVTVVDKNGKPRLESNRDFVRIEIASALSRGLRVIPVLVGGAEMPDESLLPHDLQPLAFRNAWDISDKRFHGDVQLLIDAIKRISAAAPPSLAPAPIARYERTHATISAPVQSVLSLYGVTLGETTVSEIAELGSRSDTIDNSTGKPYSCYEINGLDFWYDEESNIVDGIYLTHNEELPEPWQQLGFDWQKSYEQWLAQLTGMGYTIEIREEPRVEEYEGEDSFFAEVIGRMEHPIPHEVELDFQFSSGTETTSRATLYSISLRAESSIS